MIDDVVQYPNRYQLVPVAGTTDQFDLVRMPGAVTAVGTPINKATLLPDAVAALYGLGASALPGEALAAIKTLLNSKAKITTGSFTPNGVSRTISLGIDARFVIAVGVPAYNSVYLIDVITKIGRIDATGINSSGVQVMGYIKDPGTSDYITGSMLYLGTNGINYTAGTTGTIEWVAIG